VLGARAFASQIHVLRIFPQPKRGTGNWALRTE
jgi:hypothetical protein